jgi:hypothetical protein
LREHPGAGPKSLARVRSLIAKGVKESDDNDSSKAAIYVGVAIAVVVVIAAIVGVVMSIQKKHPGAGSSPSSFFLQSWFVQFPLRK